MSFPTAKVVVICVSQEMMWNWTQKIKVEFVYSLDKACFIYVACMDCTIDMQHDQPRYM